MGNKNTLVSEWNRFSISKAQYPVVNLIGTIVLGVLIFISNEYYWWTTGNEVSTLFMYLPFIVIVSGVWEYKAEKANRSIKLKEAKKKKVIPYPLKKFISYYILFGISLFVALYMIGFIIGFTLSS